MTSRMNYYYASSKICIYLPIKYRLTLLNDKVNKFVFVTFLEALFAKALTVIKAPLREWMAISQGALGSIRNHKTVKKHPKPQNCKCFWSKWKTVCKTIKTHKIFTSQVSNLQSNQYTKLIYQTFHKWTPKLKSKVFWPIKRKKQSKQWPKSQNRKW